MRNKSHSWQSEEAEPYRLEAKADLAEIKRRIVSARRCHYYAITRLDEMLSALHAELALNCTRNTPAIIAKYTAELPPFVAGCHGEPGHVPDKIAED